MLIKCAMKIRFNNNWEKTRRNEQVHFYRMLIEAAQNEIDKFSKKMSFENRCIMEIENHSLWEIEMHKHETTQWMEKYDDDLNKTEIDIQIAANDLEAMKMNYESIVENIKKREQDMKDFIALKEERLLQKDSALNKLILEYKNHLLGQ